MEDINKRVKMILELKKVSQSQFSKEIESTQQYVSAILKGDRKVGSNIIDRILKAYPDISKYWLLTGDGEITSDVKLAELKELSLKKFPERKNNDFGIKEKKDNVSKHFKEVGTEKIIVSESKVDPTGFYYPNVSAAAGMDKKMVNDELKRIPINLPNWEKGIDFINVYGDSMYPKFCSGEIIGIKEVELQYLNYGFAYVVILKDEQVLLKFVKKSKKENYIILESENKFYESKEYHIDQIKKVFIIKGVITKTTM